MVEAMLMEEFHWLPKEIAEIPYKTLQKFFIIRQQRQNVSQNKQAVAAFKNQHQSRGSGQSKRFYREV